MQGQETGHGSRKNLSSGPNSEAGDGSAHRQPGGPPPPSGRAENARYAGHSLPRFARAAAGEDARGLQAGFRSAGRIDVFASFGTRAGGIPARHPPRGKPAGAENAAQWRATARRGRGCVEIHGSGRNHCGRRYGLDHHAQQEDPRVPPKKGRGLSEMKDPRQIAVVGVAGYTGLELARILLRHPGLETPIFYVRDANGTKCLAERFPQFRGWGEAPLRLLSVEAITSSGAGIAFLATPHEASAELAPPLLQAGLRVVDLSGAFRFRGAETFTSWYKLPAPHAEWLSEAAYGIPEIYSKEIAAARLVANPGCYATSVILALRPITDSSWIATNTSVVCGCMS